MDTGMLNGKAVVVTGAGRGLGRAYAQAIANAGGRVIVNDIDPASATTVCEEIENAGGVAEPYVGSVADWDTAQGLIGACTAAFGSIDGLVNNAAVTGPVRLQDETEASITRKVTVNVSGVLFCGIAALQKMVEQRSGCIVNVGSRGMGALPALATYGATKGAVASATWCWALETQDLGIRVNAILPSASTPGAEEAKAQHRVLRGGQMPIARAGEGRPEDVAGVVVYLLSDRAAHITGQLVRMEQGTLGLVVPPRYTDSAEVHDLSADGIANLFESKFDGLLQPFSFLQDHYPA